MVLCSDSQSTLTLAMGPSGATGVIQRRHSSLLLQLPTVMLQVHATTPMYARNSRQL